MLDHYPDLPRDMTGLHAEFINGDIGGWFTHESSEGPVFQRGKHRGLSLAQVAEHDLSYLRWPRSAGHDVGPAPRAGVVFL